MKYTFTVEIEADDVIGAKEVIAFMLEQVGKVKFTKVEECDSDGD